MAERGGLGEPEVRRVPPQDRAQHAEDPELPDALRRQGQLLSAQQQEGHGREGGSPARWEDVRCAGSTGGLRGTKRLHPHPSKLTPRRDRKRMALSWYI